MIFVFLKRDVVVFYASKVYAGPFTCHDYHQSID